MEESSDDDRTHGEETATSEELRAVGFRLREIQRLLAVRVEQENRRLEADGLDPVTDTDRFGVDREDD